MMTESEKEREIYRDLPCRRQLNEDRKLKRKKRRYQSEENSISCSKNGQDL